MTKRPLPHLNVYTRLKPSALHGVGVFAIRNIPKGTQLFDGNEEIIWIGETQIAHLPRSLRQMYEGFCIIKDGRYGCPLNFNNLTMAWYLNDSATPNVIVDDNYNMWTIRDIAEGEELTIDSSRFSEQPYRQLAAETRS
jgi:SET domain-containing protein